MPRQVKGQRVIAKIERGADLWPHAMLSPDNVVAALRSFIGARADEVFVAVFLNPRNKILGYTEYTSGSPSMVAVVPFGVLRDALLVNASGIITAHQHPSGSASPSADDRSLWGRIREAANNVGLAVLDNLVIANGEYFSESSESISRFSEDA